MFSCAELKAQITRKGYSQKSLANAIGISPKTLYLKMKTGKFGTDEVCKIMQVLDIADPTPIFLPKSNLRSYYQCFTQIESPLIMRGQRQDFPLTLALSQKNKGEKNHESFETVFQ